MTVINTAVQAGSLSLNDFDTFGSTMGRFDRQTTLELYGMNHRLIPRPVPSVKDRMGYVFFTRPLLNLSDPNITGYRKIASSYKTNDKLNTRAYIRHMLDPRLTKNSGKICPLVNNSYAFIPILSNHCLTLSGFPEPSAEVFTSKPNQYGGVWGITDGHCQTYQNYTLSMTCRNSPGSPILNMMDLWFQYPSLVFEGLYMSPYPDFIFRNEIDYQSSVYRFIMDPTLTKINHAVQTVAAWPMNPPYSSVSDYDREDVYNQNHKTLNIQWNAIGTRFNDPIIYECFNKVVCAFNPAMRDDKRASAMIKLSMSELYTPMFNNIGYPRININTMELEWWVELSIYNTLNASYESFKNKTGLISL